MQCDNCGTEIVYRKHPNGTDAFETYRGFVFCLRPEEEAHRRGNWGECFEEFKDKLFDQAAQARKEAERKTETPVAKISSDTYEVVDAIGSDRGKINLPNLRRTDKEFYRPSKRSHPTGKHEE